MVHITAELTHGTQVTLSNGRHTWRSDEPPASGGDDTGPSPYELLLGSLAACTAITLALYCRHKGIPLKAVETTYEHRKVQPEGETGSKTGPVDSITGKIRIAGEFTDEQRKRLAQIAERCPVHRTLAGGVKMLDQVEFA